MKPHKTTYLVVILLLFATMTTSRLYGQQNDSFDGFYEAKQKQFDRLSQAKNEEFLRMERQKQIEFATFLERSWQRFETKTNPIPKPIPYVRPTYTENTPKPTVELPTNRKIKSAPQIDKRQIATPSQDNQNVITEKGKFSFLGYAVSITYDTKFRGRLASTNETSIANFWRHLSQANFDRVVFQSEMVGKALSLNDWGYYLLVSQLADCIYSDSQHNEKTIFTAFILDVAGLDVRIGLDKSTQQLLLMLSVADEIYSLEYLEEGNKSYYVVNLSPEARGPFVTYSDTFKKTDKRQLHLAIEKPLKTKGDTRTRTLNWKQQNKEIKIEYSQSAIDLYKLMPSSANISVFFNSECSTEITRSLLSTMGEQTEGMNDVEKVRYLLRFVQQCFPYESDIDQFGYENYFFYEESFFYPKNDCEDRSVLFSYLVRRLTGLKVVGLIYPGHAATAVCFDKPAEGAYIEHGGLKYTICDPTYIDADIGVCIPEFADIPADIVEIR